MEESHIMQPVQRRVLLALRHQRGNPFNANHLRRTLRQRQGKVAHAAKEVQHAILRLDIQPFQRRTHHQLVYAIVHLDKIARTEH